MEVGEHSRSNEDVQVCGKMHLLISGHFESKEHLLHTLQDVYNNFTLIRKALLDRLDDVNTRFPLAEVLSDMIRWDAGLVITFCRCKLNQIMEEDEITINPSLASLLEDIEWRLLVYILKGDNPFSDIYIWTPFSVMKEMMEKLNDVKYPLLKNSESSIYRMGKMMENIKKAYSEPRSPIYSYQLIITHDQMMELLNHCLEDLDCFKEARDHNMNRNRKLVQFLHTFLKENITLVRNYLEFFTKEHTTGENLEKLLIAVENAAYYMSRYFFFAGMCVNVDLKIKKSPEEFHDIQCQFHSQVRKVLGLQSDGFSTELLRSDELVIGHVRCVQYNLLELLKNKSIRLTDVSKGQLMVLHEGLSFLMHLLITYLSKQEKLSNIRLDVQNLATNVGSVTWSCFDNPKIEKTSFLLFDLLWSWFNKPKIEETSLQLFDLLDKNDAIRGEIIKIICCIVLESMGRESPKQDQLSSLVLLLQNLKEFMDRKPDWGVTWKDHQNLVLFIFYLVQNNIRGPIFDDELSRNTTQLDVALISHKEFDEVLISNQVVAFNMACHSLLRRNERFRWWELYMGTKEYIDMQMCIGTLKAIVLSSTTPLTNERLFAYGECVQDTLIKLQRDEDFGPLKDQFNILHEGISTLGRLLLSYKDEQEKVLQIKVDVQELVLSVASVICFHFSNRVDGDTANQSSSKIFNLVEKLNLIIVETEEVLYLVNIEKIRRESSKTDPLGSLNILLRNWKELIECESMKTWNDQFQMIHENLGSFKPFITNSSLDDYESQLLCSTIMDVVYVAEYLLTTFSIGACPVRCRDGWISELIELNKAAAMVVDEKKSIVKKINTDEKDQGQISAQTSLVPPSTYVVGFEVEMTLIMERLAGHRKHLDVISIIGMPGLGKTTLARKAFEAKYTVEEFHMRAWCYISQKYNKKDMLLTILGCIIEVNDEIRCQSADKLTTMVHKQLKGRRYLIILDDVWDINVFMYLKRFFPDDKQGSRIMLTSRWKEIGSHAKADCHDDLIEPRILTHEQSWDLLEQKVYNKLKCPPELRQLGERIAIKCKGLPLAIVVVGGVLAKGDQKQEFWEQVMKNLNSYLARDPESQFMAALELSYKFLPDHLKPMFLYIGAFPEAEEIYADKLMQLCTAEGFIQRTESTSYEIQAETNLLDLVNRSLVMVGKRRWDGRVKTCHIHDLLRDMCLVKAKEEKFMEQVRVHDELPDPVMYQRRLSIFFERNDPITSKHLNSYIDLPKFSITPPTYSLLFFYVGQDKSERKRMDLKPVISSLKLLKVLDADIEITQDVLDKDLIMLVHLRHLSFCCDYNMSIPSSISRLRSLETLIIKSNYTVKLKVPETIWEMTKLRHLDISRNLEFSAAPKSDFILENLETLSVLWISAREEETIFKKIPSLKILKCQLDEDDDLSLNFESLSKLESLKINAHRDHKFTGQLKVSSTLKTLKVYSGHLEWSQMSIFQTLPNLEALTLVFCTVENEDWNMGDDDVFNNLKVLKLKNLNITRWSASSENFPKLKELVLRGEKLEEIPDLGEFDTLEKIVVTNCNDNSTLVKRLKEIQNEQEGNGYHLLKFLYIYEDEDAFADAFEVPMFDMQ